MKRRSIHARSFASVVVIFCMLAAPLAVMAKKKGEKNYKEGLRYEAAQQWDKAAQEFTLAVAADPSSAEYQLHYRRAVFNASQMFMQQGRALAEQRDYLGAYNAFRQAYGYDPVNELALSEMERMLRLQREKTGEPGAGDGGNGSKTSATSYTQGTGATPGMPSPAGGQQETAPVSTRPEQIRDIRYTGDLKGLIRSLADSLGLNVVFDSQTFRTPRNVEVNLREVTTAQALDLIFIQEGLFFQKLNRKTILVADQNRRAQYQQLVIRTFYLANIKPEDAQRIVSAAIPPNQGRPQTIVLQDKDTNSLTIRDTPENLRLIGEILQSLDKDRAEVVMDVNIYEVSRTDLLQFGNQVGSGSFNLGGSPGVTILTDNATVNGGRGVNLAGVAGAVPTALAAALVIPPSVLTALQTKDRSRLLASTQVHAFNNEESTARIGQRVPVQTAQTYPFSTVPSTTTGGTPSTPTPGVFSGGFPVIQYEPTGLTLKFTPQVFPNLDVQVKMSIESKDILNAGSLTPTFTERTITGTARIQNNRTMMIASVAQDTQSNGRRGLPVLGLIPVLGRLFTSPTRNNNQVDIVIAVTPRVLRAPSVTPFDERERPSGTLSTPTNSSLEAMMQEVDREDQLAAARRIPVNVSVQIPDAAAPPPAYVPAPKALMSAGNDTPPAQQQPAPAKIETATTATVVTPTLATSLSQPSNALANAIAQLTGEEPPSPAALIERAKVNTPRAIEVAQPLTAPTMLLPDTASAGKLPTAIMPEKKEAAPAPSSPKTQANAGSSTSITEKLKKGLFGKPPEPNAVSAEAVLMPGQKELRVGEKQRVALVLVSKEPLGNAIVRLRFDASKVMVRGVAPSDWPDGPQLAPVIMQSVDPAGILTLAVSPQAGSPLKAGANVILYVEVEGVAAGEGVIDFEPMTAHLVTPDGRPVRLKMTDCRLLVK